MKKLYLSLSLIIVFAFYSFWTTSKVKEVASSPTPVTSELNVTPTKPKISASASIKYKNGTYTGPVVDVFYGNVEVQATIANSKLTDIKFLQYPNDQETSQEKSAHAMPILKSEAIKVQSATVDMVSGATQTSTGFIKSLTQALVQAKI
ncbi:MAG: FMN-binding protein [Candidatus Paceibacterota bacterium]